MTIARGAALAALALALVVLAVLLLGAGSGHEYKLVFQNAGQLVKGDDVQVGGRRVGQVKGIALTRDNQAEITVDVEDGYAPLHKGTKATIRATSLSGVANRYIALALGPNNGPELPDGARVGADSTTTIVDLDQLFNTFDKKTLKSLQRVVQGSGDQFKGREQLANAAAHYLSPTLSSTARLVNELDRDKAVFTRFVVETSKTMSALASRKSDLTGLVTNANKTSAAIADESASLTRALDVLPGTLRRSNTTFVNLRAALDDLNRLVDESKPATRRLAPFLAALRPLVADARPTVADLRSAIRRPGSANDLIEVTGQLPSLARAAKPTFRGGVTALKGSQPVLEFLRPYTPDLVGWFRDFGQGASTYDGNGHYARIGPFLNVFDSSSGTLKFKGFDSRFTGMQNGVLRRCPGTASQPRPDGGNPWADLAGTSDCDPGLVPPGP